MEDCISTFEEYIKSVEPENVEFITLLHNMLLESDCKYKTEVKSSGNFISYMHIPSKKVLLNIVTRKKGQIVRIYGNCVNEYLPLIDSFPENMVTAYKKSPVCKKLINPNECSSNCAAGYDFTVNGLHHQKCRYSAFMFEINLDNDEYIKAFVEKEMYFRTVKGV